MILKPLKVFVFSREGFSSKPILLRGKMLGQHSIILSLRYRLFFPSFLGNAWKQHSTGSPPCPKCSRT